MDLMISPSHLVSTSGATQDHLPLVGEPAEHQIPRRHPLRTAALEGGTVVPRYPTTAEYRYVVQRGEYTWDGVRWDIRYPAITHRPTILGIT